MSRGSTRELDFFRMEKETSSVAAAYVKPKPLITKKLFERRKSFRDIQSVISKMNPEVVKAVIGSAKPLVSTMSSFSDVPSTPTPTPTPTPREHQTFPITPLPLYTPTYRPLGDSENGEETAQLTVFYNGTVSVFDDVPRNKAEFILQFAKAESLKTVQSMKVGIASSEFVRNFEADLPLARRRSLERFLEKRKERLIMALQYANGSIKGVGLEEYNPRTHLYL